MQQTMAVARRPIPDDGVYEIAQSRPGGTCRAAEDWMQENREQGVSG
jgi:hypothetical protein